ASVLSSYQLNAGDAIQVDDGTYTLTTNLALTTAQNGIKIEGYYDDTGTYVGRKAVLNRGNTNNNVIEVTGVGITLAHLQITGGASGVVGTGASRLTVSNSVVYGNNNYGIWLNSGSDHALVTASQVSGQGTGVFLAGNDGTVSNSQVFNN